MLVSFSRGSHQAPLEPLEAGMAKHLARERFQAIDRALHRAMTPGQGDPSFDGVVVVAQPFRKPLQGREGTLRCPCLPLADQLGNILGEREGVASDGWPKTTAQSCSYRPSQHQGDVHQPVHEPLRSSRPWRDQHRQPFGEHAACAAATGTKELPYLQVEHNTALRQPRSSPAQGATRETALALVGKAWGVRATRRVAQHIACPDGMDEAQCAQLPDGQKVKELRYRVQRQGFRVKAITLHAA
jgi:hypothetical protein